MASSASRSASKTSPTCRAISSARSAQRGDHEQGESEAEGEGEGKAHSEGEGGAALAAQRDLPGRRSEEGEGVLHGRARAQAVLRRGLLRRLRRRRPGA